MVSDLDRISPMSGMPDIIVSYGFSPERQIVLRLFGPAFRTKPSRILTKDARAERFIFVWPSNPKARSTLA